jgi:3-oxoacyl-(acyl-carrier-protein) synthase
MNLSTIFKLKGVNFTVSAACASGSHSIGMGYFLIKHGLQESVICGGAQEINYHSMQFTLHSHTGRFITLAGLANGQYSAASRADRSVTKPATASGSLYK